MSKSAGITSFSSTLPVDLQATWEVERAISHHIAHDLNNALGAIEIFSEMIVDDISDPTLRARLEKMKLAAGMARGHVDVLRRVIPKHLAGRGLTSLVHVLSLTRQMLGDQAARFDVLDSPDYPLVGEVSAVVYVIYQLAGHVLGSHSGTVSCVSTLSKDHTDLILIDIKATGFVNELSWERPFFDDVLSAFGASVRPIGEAGACFGFSLHWPCVPV